MLNHKYTAPSSTDQRWHLICNYIIIASTQGFRALLHLCPSSINDYLKIRNLCANNNGPPFIFPVHNYEYCNNTITSTAAISNQRLMSCPPNLGHQDGITNGTGYMSSYISVEHKFKMGGMIPLKGMIE